MLFRTPLTLALLIGIDLAAAGKYSKSYKPAFHSETPTPGLSRRQDSGYSPTEVRCGPGVDCAASCGIHYIQCASDDGGMHCYDPTVKKEKCCRDGNGHSCRDGYFCTSDSSGGTWCCPDGMDLETCAQNYHLTDTLVSQDPTPKPTAHQNATPTDASVTSPPSGFPIYTLPPYQNQTHYNNGTYTPPPKYTNTTTSYTTIGVCTKSCHATNLPIGNTTSAIIGPTGVPPITSTSSVVTTTTARAPSSTQFTDGASSYIASLDVLVIAAFAVVFAL